MAYAVSRHVAESFYRAYMSRDPQQIGALLDDNVEWIVTGPVEVMQVCGIWRGKQAVIDRFSSFIPKVIQFKHLQIEALLVDGDSSAMFGRFACVHCPTGRQISHRVTHLVRYRDGKVVNYRAMSDSLDAAEQYVGHHIPLAGDAPAMIDDDVIAV
jgi:ketosteroid isomerase-like protein